MRHIFRDLILYSRVLDLIVSILCLPFTLACKVFWFAWGRRPLPPMIEFVELAHATGGPRSCECDKFLDRHLNDKDLWRRAEAYRKLWDATQRNVT